MEIFEHRKMLFDNTFESKMKAKKHPDTWQRRAIFWKYMAMAIESEKACSDKMLKTMYETALAADLQSSPTEEAIDYISRIAIPAFNSRNKSKIEIVKT
jgi:hypothetical protein